jgi:hypothetical protein
VSIRKEEEEEEEVVEEIKDVMVIAACVRF